MSRTHLVSFPFISGSMVLLAVVGSVVWLSADLSKHVLAQAPAQAGAAPAGDGQVAVEKDMHEFMEYLFQPTYRRLKAQMANTPANAQAWTAIKSDGLILAEGGNLLLLRLPEKDAKNWIQLSKEVRDLGGQLYQAGKKREFTAAKQHYTAMITKCNACHQQFADGEHQLVP